MQIESLRVGRTLFGIPFVSVPDKLISHLHFDIIALPHAGVLKKQKEYPLINMSIHKAYLPHPSLNQYVRYYWSLDVISIRLIGFYCN